MSNDPVFFYLVMYAPFFGLILRLIYNKYLMYFLAIKGGVKNATKFTTPKSQT